MSLGIVFKNRFSIISFGIDDIDSCTIKCRNRFYKPLSKKTLQESVLQFESDSYNKIGVGIGFFNCVERVV